MERIEELDETSDIQAVVAAVRNRADEIRGNLGPKYLWEERVERADELMEIAGRIEAAAKREHQFRDAAKLIGIVHKMRGAFEKILAIEGYGAPWIEAKTIAQKALEIALPDRRYAQNPESLSNTAKIREALEEIIDALNEARTEGRIKHWEYSNLFDICDSALAAPPRNCDVYATEYDANEAFDKMCAQRGGGIHACIGCKYNAAERGGFPSISRCRVAWLFDAAQEGGDHANA